MRTKRAAPPEIIVAVNSTGKAIVNGPMVKPASQLNPVNTAVETIPATKEMLRSVTLIETMPSTIAPANAIQRMVATNSGFTGRLWICRDQS